MPTKTYDFGSLNDALHRRAMSELSHIDKYEMDQLGNINPSPGSELEAEVEGWYQAAHQFITDARARKVVSTEKLGSTHGLYVQEAMDKLFAIQSSIDQDEDE